MKRGKLLDWLNYFLAKKGVRGKKKKKEAKMAAFARITRSLASIRSTYGSQPSLYDCIASRAANTTDQSSKF
jgi:hypothetical protein